MSGIYFLATKIFLQPLPLLLSLIGAGLVWMWRRRRESRRVLLVLIVPLVALVAAQTPVVVFPLVGTLEWGYPPVARRPTDSEAIVVLSGGVYEPDAVRPEAVPREDTLYRCLEAARMYHQGAPCPVIVTGGMLDPEGDIPPVAPTMRETLVSLGVAGSDVVVEPKARTTYENAVETRKILEERGLRRVVVVTEAVHMGRSLACFRKVGVDATPAACLHRATQFKWKLDRFVPSPQALEDLMAVLHEWLGLAWYRASGKI